MLRAQDSELPLRPGYGNAGQRLKVIANHFPFIAFPSGNIHHYDIDIVPDTPRNIKRQLFACLAEQYRDVIGNLYPVYDGQKSMYSPKRLNIAGDSRIFEVALSEFGSTKGSKQRIFKVKVQKVAEIYMEELHRFIDGKADFTGNVQTSIMALDILFRHFPAMGHPVIGRSFFLRDKAVPLGGGVEMWRGVFQSVRPGNGKLFLNVDVAASAFVRPLQLPDYVADVLGRAPEDLQRQPLTEHDRRRVERMLKMVQIETIHRSDRRKYKVSKVSAEPANRLQFTQEDGTKMTIADYFKKAYGKALRYPILPCVAVGDVRKGIFLPMEVCKVVEGQRYTKKLDDKQTAAMIRQTASKPRDRLNDTTACVNLLRFSENSYLDAFGVKVNSKMSQIEARQLMSPKLVCHQTSRGGNTAIVDNGSWDLRDRRYVSLATLSTWAVIPFCDAREVDFDTVKRFITELTEQCKKSGINIVNPNPFIEKPVGRACDVPRAINCVIQKVQDKMKAPPQLILAIVPFSSPIYHDIKRHLELAGGPGIPSQVVQLKHVKAAKAQFCADLGMQINTKLGGLNWNLSKNDLPFLSAAPTIIFGADVTHPSPGENDKPSIAAVVASMSQDGTRYSTQLRKQASRTEIIEDLDEMVIVLLKRFYAATKCQPRQILFYRDGVSEGQFRAVQESEINAIRKACHRLHPSYNPKITFVVVQKRHHTRFYGINQQDMDKSGNLKSGLVVDSVVTHPTQFCFYLQSQRGIVGTCKPAYYHVLCDENNFTPDSLQRLTFNLCHILQRATKAVSYCTPAYYAHIVAFRAKSYVDASTATKASETGIIEIHPNLEGRMWFL